MNDVIGIAWYKDEATYRRALAIFTDSENMPASFEDWKALGKHQGSDLLIEFQRDGRGALFTLFTSRMR
jgi:hypothetical protein